MPKDDFLANHHTAIASLDGSWSCPGTASGSRIGHSIHCTDNRLAAFEEAFSKHRYYLMKSGTCMRKFHVAQVSIHRDISRDSDVQPMLKNLVMPSSNCNGSEVVLFLDETSHNWSKELWCPHDITCLASALPLLGQAQDMPPRCLHMSTLQCSIPAGNSAGITTQMNLCERSVHWLEIFEHWWMPDLEVEVNLQMHRRHRILAPLLFFPFDSSPLLFTRRHVECS